MPRKKKNDKNRVRLLITHSLGFILAISVALPAYTQSNFLKQFVSLEVLSLFFVIANLFTIIAILFYPNIIKRLTNYFVAKIVILIYFASLLLLVVANTPLAALLSIIIFSVTSNLIWINLDVLIESFSTNARTGKIRTTNLTFINVGWILAPNLAGYLVVLGGYSLAFLISAAVTIPFFLIFFFQGKNLKDKIKYPKEKLLKSLKKIWKTKNLRGIFFISLLLSIFYSCAVVYVPLYLHQTLGIDWKTLGMMFAVMLLPFILLQIPAGIIADKYIGEKEMMATGIGILIISLFLFFYINTPVIWLWTSILFLSRVGAALVEAMRETYFFKIVSVKDVELINLFRATNPLGYMLGPALAMIVLAFLPIHYIFLILSIIVFSGFGFIAIIKDTK